MTPRFTAFEFTGSIEDMSTQESHELQFRPGQYLFREGEVSNAIYLIKKGTVAIRKRKGTAYVELGRLYSNEVLGELSFFDREPRSAGAVALTEVEVTMIPFDSLDQIYAKVPDYLKTIIASVANRLRRANELIRSLQREVVTESGGAAPAATGKLSASDALAMANSASGTSEVTIPSDIPLGSLDKKDSADEPKE
jgi:CRP-like cAMP-binding protein